MVHSMALYIQASKKSWNVEYKYVCRPKGGQQWGVEVGEGDEEAEGQEDEGEVGERKDMVGKEEEDKGRMRGGIDGRRRRGGSRSKCFVLLYLKE